MLLVAVMRLNKAIDVIGKHGPCSRREMFHKGLKLAGREFSEVIEVLLASGVVIETEPLPYSGVGRPPGPRYVLVQAAEGHSADEVDRDE